MKKRFLLIPSCKKGNGSGHVQRMLLLYYELKVHVSVFLLLPCKVLSPGIRELVKKIPHSDIFEWQLPEQMDWDVIVVDKRKTEKNEWLAWKDRGFIIGIDEGGPYRKDFPCLIDIIPGIHKKESASIENPAFIDLPLPAHRKIHEGKYPDKKLLRVLISFGGEDTEHLTEKVISSLMKLSLIEPENITLVKGPLFGNRVFPENINLLRAPGSLKEDLYKYDIVFTSYGLTAFEAAAAGVKIILFNPSRYHHRLSKKQKFYEIGVRNVRLSRLKKAIVFPDKISNPLFLLKNNFNTISLSSFLRDLKLPDTIQCPVCRSHYSVVKERFPYKTYFTCKLCGIDYLLNFSIGRKRYKKNYFFSEYKKQYGKTYLEDFSTIRRFASSRLEIISHITRGKRILDIGCAYGPFLEEALYRGFLPTGLEIVPEAAHYVNRVLGIPVMNVSFEDALIEEAYDCVTMWFVIEHFKKCGDVLAKVNKIVKTGGVFAFSTPNSSGITGRSRKKHFFRQSPEDHITIWNPKSAALILKLYGFQVKKIKITGHHPERFPGILKGSSGWKRFLVNRISILLGLGDTFEVYAVKKKEYLP